MLLRLSRGEETIREAMDLHEWGAAPALNELSDTKQAPNQCVVLGANQVVGYFDVDDLKIPHATRGGTTRGAPNDLEILPPQDETVRDATQGSPVVAERSVEAEFPNTVPLDELASLTVSLVRNDDLQSPTAGRIPLALPVGTVIDILVQTRRGFVIEGPAERSLTTAATARCRWPNPLPDAR
jgi:hypothetical protein